MNTRRNVALFLEDAPAASDVSAAGLSKALVPMLLELAPHVSATMIVQTHDWIPLSDVLEIGQKQQHLAGRWQYWAARLIARVKGTTSVKLAQLHGMLIGRKLRAMLDRSGSTDVIWGAIGVDLLSLVRLDAAAKAAGRPFEAYLVDDIENHPSNIRRKNAASVIKNILHRAACIYTITPELGEVIDSRYGVQAVHLPLAKDFSIENKVFIAKPKYLAAYLGGINHLYEDGIRLLIQHTRYLRERTGQNLIIRLISSSNDVVRVFGGTEFIPEWVHYGRVDGNPGEVLFDSQCCFLPYSFDESAKTMTSTSFPSKLLDYFGWARSIVVFAPRYSVPYKLFERLDLDFVTDDSDQLLYYLDNLTKKFVDRTASYRTALIEEHGAKNVVAIIMKSTRK